MFYITFLTRLNYKFLLQLRGENRKFLRFIVYRYRQNKINCIIHSCFNLLSIAYTHTQHQKIHPATANSPRPAPAYQVIPPRKGGIISFTSISPLFCSWGGKIWSLCADAYRALCRTCPWRVFGRLYTLERPEMEFFLSFSYCRFHSLKKTIDKHVKFLGALLSFP